jgi:hypothetical protein
VDCDRALAYAQDLHPRRIKILDFHTRRATIVYRESTSWHQVGRPKYLVHELFGLEPDTGLLWLAGLAHTIKFYAPGYYELRQCAQRALPNPYYQA